MKAVYGEGALGKRNILQLIHSCYDLQECFLGKEFPVHWKLANPDDPFVPNRMSAAVLTCWWYVNTAAQHLYENWDSWKRFATRCRNRYAASTRAGKITQSILSFMNEPKLAVDLKFINAFSEIFFVHHFEWLQSHDDIANDFGYNSWHMAVQHFVIEKELSNLAENWQTHAKFLEFRVAAAGLEDAYTTMNATQEEVVEEDEGEEEQEVNPQEENDGVNAAAGGHGLLGVAPTQNATPRQLSFTEDDATNDVKEFFQIAIDSVSKHFKLWTHGDLLSYAIAGDHEIMTALAHWAKDGTIPGDDEILVSERHECDINLKDFIEFCAKPSTPEQLRSTTLVRGHQLAVDALANGKSLWENTTNMDVVRLAKWCKRHIVPHMSSTHHVEPWFS